MRRVVFPDPFCRIADKTDAARVEIGQAAEIVEHGAVGAQRQRVHREVPPQRILAPVGREGDRGAPAVGLDVAAQGRDLKARAGRDGGHRAMRNSCRHDAQSGRFQPPHRLVRRQRHADVDVADRAAEQGVAHAAADKADIDAAVAQCRHDRHHRGPAHPVFEDANFGLARAGVRCRRHARRQP